MRRGDAEERAEGGVSGAVSVAAEDEPVAAGLEVFATQAAAASQGIVLAAADDPGFIDLDEPGQEAMD